MYERLLRVAELVRNKSVFLLGPRQTGKSTLLRTQFPQARYVDLLEANTFRELSARPESLRETLTPRDTLVVIDEIQKLPLLLDEVQAMIDRNRSVRFVLTGSSARKLRRGRANLLAGRAWFANLHPLVSAELGPDALDRRLNVGSLPAVYDSRHADEDLNAYVGVYLREEILAEGLLRSVERFSRLLEVAALVNGHILNYTSVANDVGMPPRTVREHFQVLEDTLVGAQLPAYRTTGKRKPVATAKFYFFDVGVANTLMKRSHIRPGSEAYGAALEHLVFLELRAYLDYRRRRDELTYWRTHAGHEVDFVVGGRVAIEVKGTRRVAPSDLKGLRALSEDVRLEKRLVVTTEPRTRTLEDGIVLMPVKTFLEQLWADEIVEEPR
jgi:predicted AAA+ superfamily ATPase